LYANFTKKEKPSRWVKLLREGQVKPPNMQTWWEIYEKHEKELRNFRSLRVMIYSKRLDKEE